MARKDAGFTLIEAVTVMAIVVIGLTIGVPTFNSVLLRSRVDTTVHLLTADLATARSAAIMRRAQVVVCPSGPEQRCRADQDWSAGWIVFADDDGNRQPNAEDDVIRVSTAPGAGTNALALPASRPFVRYQRDGRSANTNLTIRVCHGDDLAASVVVNNWGRTRTSRATQSGACSAS